MNFRDTLSTGIPPPRDDEPAGLRQEIFDELSDHLACAYNRELLRGANSRLATRRVVNRFGDPAALARLLWLDAMRGKIMTQRVLIATCVVVMLACGGSLGLAWQWSKQDQLLRGRATAEAIEMNRRMSEVLAQSQATNQEMLKQMRELSAAALHPVSPDWNPVTFRPHKSIVCPKTPPDRALVHVQWSWPADLAKEQLVLYAPFTFRYRKLDPGLEWAMGDAPSSSRSRRRPNQAAVINQGQALPAVRSFLCGPETTLAKILDRKKLYFWTYSRLNLQGNKIDVAKPGIWADIPMDYRREVKIPSETAELRDLGWEPGIYGIDALIVLRPARSQDIETERQRFQVLASSFVYGSGPIVILRGEPPNTLLRVGEGTADRGGPPTKKDLETFAPWFGGQDLGGGEFGGGMGGMGGGMGANNNGWQTWRAEAPTLDFSTEFWDKVDVGFEARLGQVNEWTIPVPDELTSAVRTALKVGTAARAKPARAVVPAGGG